MTSNRCIIDLGSNSVRLRVARRSRNGSIVTVFEDREMVRLGRSIFSSGQIDAHARREALAAIRRFELARQSLSGDRPLIFATAAVRDATNGPDFARAVKRITGVSVRVLSKREEGEFLLRGARERYTMDRGVRAVADLGGGSLQVVRTVRGFTCENASMPLGALRLAEKFGTASFSTEQFRRMRDFVRRVIKAEVVMPLRRCDFLAGAGGGFAASEAMARAAGLRGPVQISEVRRQIRNLRLKSNVSRSLFPGLEAKRADIIVPSLCVILELMMHLGAKEFVNYGDGVRDGMLWEAFRVPQGVSKDPLDSAHRLLDRVPQVKAHSLHVRSLAINILDELARIDPKKINKVNPIRSIIEASALMHDLGVAIDYDTHHLWSARIAMSEAMPAISDSDRNSIALLVEHHRGTELTLKVARAFGFSSEESRTLVTASSVLRAADALDRSHRGRIQGLEFGRESSRFGYIRIRAKGDVNRELKALHKKASGLLALIAPEIRVEVRSSRRRGSLNAGGGT